MLGIKHFIVTITLFALGSCANQQYPILTSNEPNAVKVRFINAIKGAWIDLYPENECNNGINIVNDNAIENVIRSITQGPPKRIEMLDPVAPGDRNISEHSFKFGQIINVGTGGACLGGLSFATKPNMQYEIKLSNQLSGQCSLTVLSLSEQGGVVSRQAVRDTQPLVCRRAFK